MGDMRKTHNPTITDSDKAFTIDPTTRELKNQSKKIVLMQGDNQSERFKFIVDEQIEGHEMIECNLVTVHYYVTETSTRKKHYGSTIIKESKGKDASGNTIESILHANFDEDGNYTGKVEFSWLITDNVTQHAGPLSFMIEFACVESTITTDDEVLETVEETVVPYRWSTNINSSVTIVPIIDSSNQVPSKYPHVLANWEARIVSLESDMDTLNEDQEGHRADVQEQITEETANHKNMSQNEIYQWLTDLDLLPTGVAEFATTEEVCYIFGLAYEDYATTAYNDSLVTEDGDNIITGE